MGPYYNTGPNTGPNLRDPKRDHNFDNPPVVEDCARDEHGWTQAEYQALKEARDGGRITDAPATCCLEWNIRRAILGVKLPTFARSNILTILNTGVITLLLLLLLLLLGVTMLIDRRCLGFAELHEKLLKCCVLQDFVCMNWLVL